MGTYQFKWQHPAEEVYVTGTFDNWSKTVKLEKEDGYFTKLVDLPEADKKIYYKFVVDGNWTTDHTAPSEVDESGNSNNVLVPAAITPSAIGGRSQHGAHPDAGPTSAFISGIGPGATTTQMAGDVPKEANQIPGAFPDEDIAPGDMVPDYSRFAQKAGDQPVSVNPLPGTAGTGNPIELKPGEKVPPSGEYTSNTIGSNVKLDKESYEKGSALPTDSKAVDTAGGAFGVPPVNSGTTFIPESSLPMGGSGPQADGGADASGLAAAGPTISSAGAGTTTAALAGQVPKEPRGVAQVVGDDSKDVGGSGPAISSAGAGTTTAALAGQVPKEPRGVPQVVDDSQVDANVTQPSKDVATGKAEIADQIKDEVPEKGKDDLYSRGGIIGAAAGAGAAAIGGVAAAAAGLLGGGKKDTENEKPSEDVPDAVKASINKAGASPEAAANPEAVSEKKEVEAQILKDGPTIADADTMPAINAATGGSTAASQTLGSGTAVDAFKSDPVAAPGHVDAPAKPQADVAAFKDDPVAPKAAGSANIAVPSDARARELSREISPHSRPTATTGVKTAQTPEKSTGTAAAPAPASSSSTPATNKTTESGETDKKAKRRSFFGRIKDKLKDKN